MADSDGPAPIDGRRPLVVHVLPYDQARGAQRYARALVEHLDGRVDNLVLTIFSSDEEGLGADIRLGIDAGRMRRAGFDLRVIPALRRALRQSSVDIVVAHGGESAKYAALAMPKSTPLVYLNIGSTHPRLGRWPSRALHRVYVRRSDAVVTVSRFLSEEAVSAHDIPLEKIVIIPNGRDPDEFSPAGTREPGISRLVWVGRLDVTKRPELFVDLVRRLSDLGLEVEARMAGDGPRVGEIKPLAEAAGVQMLGTRDDVPALLAGSDILVFTGRPPEGMPGVLIEAGLSGLATVSTAVPGADEVIEDGESGRVVGVDDFEALCDAVRALIQQEETRLRMGRNARARCLALFSFDTTVDRWEELFDDLLSQ